MIDSSTNGNRYERKKEETRQKIINVAITLFNKQGFDSTTLEQIADEADIARRTLFNHFPIKEDIISEYLKRFMREREPEIYGLIQDHPDTRSRLVAILNRLMEWAKSEKISKEIFKIYVSYQIQKVLTASSNEIHNSGVHSFLAKIIQLGQEAGEIRRDLPFEMLVFQADNIRVSAAIMWYIDPEKFPDKDYITKNVDLFLYGAVDRSNTSC